MKFTNLLWSFMCYENQLIQNFAIYLMIRFRYLYTMTIEQKKIALINWITNLDDETVIDKIEGFRKTSINELPNEIVELLNIAASEPIEDCIEHTSAQDILDMNEN
ncbi:MAG: hypothetical protein AAF363_02395 [Bacteroidota bacterium]